MRIYVVAKFEAAAASSLFMNQLRADGHVITFDWTGEDDTKFTDANERAAYVAKCAESDIEGVRTADAVIALWHPGLQGGLVEIGGALALRIPVILVGAPPDAPCIFFTLCARVLDTTAARRALNDVTPRQAKHDTVNHPQHYTRHQSGIECIQISEHFNFCRGNAIKYLWRADLKNGVEDLKKARWYIDREISRVESIG